MRFISDNIYQSTYFIFQGKRNYQEDWYHLDDENGIYIICDGIGGGVDGDLASKGIINMLVEKIEQLKQIQNEGELQKIIIDAYQDWISSIELFSNEVSMGTTLVLLIINDKKAYIAHVGDSKVYYFSEGKLKWVTKDHSVVQELYDAGVIKSREEMHDHPMKNRITNALMANPDSAPPKIDVSSFAGIREKDFFILCSDGAVENFTDQKMINLFANGRHTTMEGWRKFMEAAKDSSDNSTGILVQI